MLGSWGLLVEAARGSGAVPEVPGDEHVRLFGPVLGVRVVAHLAQSLDGRIALPDGRSRWISGDEDLEHTHRLRALVDAVVVGAHTVEVDDPQLTVRRVTGPNPVRVVIDPARRLDRSRYKVFTDDEAPTWRIVTGPADDPRDLSLPSEDGVIDPRDVVRALEARGIRRILVEGGGVTVSRFVAAHQVDRLHLVVAPVLVGAGRPGLTLPAPLADTLEACPRPPVRWFGLGRDVLLDCDLRPGARDGS